MFGPAPTHEDMAHLLGLDRWWIGGHRLSPKGDRGVWADALWLIQAEPSFHDRWSLAGVLGHDFGPTGHRPGWRRVALAQGDESAVIDVDADPVAAALNRIELICPSDYWYTDGIGYSVRVETNALSGQLHFSNPDTPSLMGLEGAALELAARAARASEQLVQMVVIWREQYATRTLPGEPSKLRIGG